MKRFVFALIFLFFATAALFAQPIADPELIIRELAAGKIEIAWPMSAVGFVLESTDALSEGAVWLPLGAGVIQQQGEFGVSISPSRRTQFFRLRQEVAPKPTTLRTTSPLDGETGVAVTRETILYFT